jgi:CheY-like chemotaxis protein
MRRSAPVWVRQNRAGRPTENIVPSTVLLIEHDAADAEAIRRALAGTGSDSFRVEWVTCLAEALECLGRAEIEAVLLDPGLPDAQGIEALDRILQVAPDALILLLMKTGDTGSALVHQALTGGVHQCVCMNDPDAARLPRTLRRAIDDRVASRRMLSEAERC